MRSINPRFTYLLTYLLTYFRPRWRLKVDRECAAFTNVRKNVRFRENLRQVFRLTMKARTILYLINICLTIISHVFIKCGAFWSLGRQKCIQSLLETTTFF